MAVAATVAVVGGGRGGGSGRGVTLKLSDSLLNLRPSFFIHSAAMRLIAPLAVPDSEPYLRGGRESITSLHGTLAQGGMVVVVTATARGARRAARS